MNKMLSLAIVNLALLMPLLAVADEGLYVGVQGGVNFLESSYLKKNNCSFDTGYNVGGISGYGWCNGCRLEAEIAYRDNDYRLRGVNEDSVPTTFHGNIESWSFMANGYYDFPVCFWEIITPYVGAGIGCDRVHQTIKIEGENFSGSNTGFAWQLAGGAAFCLFEDLSLSVEYKFHMAPLRRGHELQNHSVIVKLQKFFSCCF